MGGIVFADVRDHTGLCQIVSDDRSPPEAVEALAAIRAEWVVCARGRVRRRVAPNPKMPTGAIEVAVDSVEVLNVVQRSLPFAVSESGGGEADTDEIREEVRLKHRVLDLRRPQMVRNLRLRARTIGALRRVLEERHGFMEIETPMLTRSTPEGARDYLVPSRVQPGACYALPQSPQLFKQMLMVAGADRYYQVARCFRDEDLRADRQPEFTQLDLEMAFTDEDGVLDLGEDLLCAAFETGAGVTLKRPFPRMTYAEAMRRYGCDKPDTRYGLEMAELNDALAGSEFKLFSGAIESGGVVKAIAVPEGARLSNSRLKPKGDVFDEAVKGGAGGLAYARVVEADGEGGGGFEGGKALCAALAERRDAVLAATGAKPGDLLLFGVGAESVANKSLDRVRQYVAKTLDMIPEGGDPAVLWITEFPMFERNEEEDRLEALHHPFTAPNQEDVADGGDVRTARAIAYDLVVNGVEIGGGSLRIYRRDVQERVFEAIGLSEAEAEEKFGYLMEAFQFGAPPHGGMAFGLDRLVMMLAGAKSIRDVIAFPKTATAQCLLTSAPGDVSDAQLEELHVMKAPSVSTSVGGGGGGGEEGVNAAETNAPGMTKKKAANRPRKSLLFVQVETGRLSKKSASPGGLERRGRREDGRRSSPSLATRLLDKWTMRFLSNRPFVLGGARPWTSRVRSLGAFASLLRRTLRGASPSARFGAVEGRAGHSVRRAMFLFDAFFFTVAPPSRSRATVS